MSVESSVFRQVLRRTGGLLSSSLDVQTLRNKIDGLVERLPDVPRDVGFRSFEIDHIPAYWYEPEDAIPGAVLLYLHGGGYIFCSAGNTHRELIYRLAKASRCRVLAIDYRLAPEHPFPAAIDDTVLAYRWLLEQDVNLNKLAIAGDSAGGGLTFGSLIKMRDEGLLLPVAAVGISPWSDLAGESKSLAYNLEKDLIIPGDGIKEGADFYLGDVDPRTPYASPVYGDLSGLPPSLIQVGGDEVLLDDSRRLAEALKQAGVPVLLQEWEGMQHVWQVFSKFLPEGRQAIDQIGEFLQSRLG